MKRKADPLIGLANELRITTGLLAAITYQRTGVRPKGFDHLYLPDPWLRLVPYAKALALLSAASAPSHD